MFNATESLWFKGVATFSSGGKTTDWSFQVSACDLARNAYCVMATSAASERVFSMDGHVVNSRRANLMSSSVSDKLFFNSALKVTKCSRLTKRFHIFKVSFKSFCWLWNEPLNNLPLAMKYSARVFSGFQTHSDRCRFGTETVRGGCRFGLLQPKISKLMQEKFNASSGTPTASNIETLSTGKKLVQQLWQSFLLATKWL